ncbi:polysaccharide biosynthesis/export family protein [Novosphingobium soli]|uniref:Polysaccharide biosynthesis/export family protein n=1 Tax=Novosphingobium soli TaxID=574956 RepID=A0ABV6CU71_9SPHN
MQLRGGFALDSEGVLNFRGRTLRCALLLGVTLTIGGCALAPLSGPTSAAIGDASREGFDQSSIAVIDVSNDIARRLVEHGRPQMFADVLGEGQPVGTVIGKGDTLDISIWEAPPATLFGSGGGDSRVTSSASTARGTSLPEQMVDEGGRVVIPFVGSLAVVGLTPKQVEQQIVSRLAGKAHQPQALVRLTGNANRTVTVVGEVTNSSRVPLSPRGERLLDVLASVGGTRQQVTKTTVQITRDGTVASMPMEAVIRDPRQNIRLQPGDVVTALFQPFSFTALGATGRNEEVLFEASGLTLSQALGRAAGLQDARANAKGVFLFRLEDPAALAGLQVPVGPPTPDGKIPVIYRINLRDPRTLFVAQSFPIRDRDVLYVTNAPIADVQKFVNVIYSSILPIATAATVSP